MVKPAFKAHATGGKLVNGGNDSVLQHARQIVADELTALETLYATFHEKDLADRAWGMQNQMRQSMIRKFFAQSIVEAGDIADRLILTLKAKAYGTPTAACPRTVVPEIAPR